MRSAPFIGHLYCMTLSSPMLQENCQMISNEGQLTPFSMCGWTVLRDVSQAKLSAVENECRKITYGFGYKFVCVCCLSLFLLPGFTKLNIDDPGLPVSQSLVFIAPASWTQLQKKIISYLVDFKIIVNFVVNDSIINCLSKCWFTVHQVLFCTALCTMYYAAILTWLMVILKKIK